MKGTQLVFKWVIHQHLSSRNFDILWTGKRRCLEDAGHILRIMSDLLGHENLEVIVLNNNIGIKHLL